MIRLLIHLDNFRVTPHFSLKPLNALVSILVAIRNHNYKLTNLGLRQIDYGSLTPYSGILIKMKRIKKDRKNKSKLRKNKLKLKKLQKKEIARILKRQHLQLKWKMSNHNFCSKYNLSIKSIATWRLKSKDKSRMWSSKKG